MPEYDFSTLSPYDFEILSRDLLQKEWGVQLESFKNGRDKGIDLRYSTPSDRSKTIIQCKHYRGSGFSKLLRTLEKSEKPKVERLNPTRYVVTTSVSLSVAEKDKLFNALSPYCQSTADILGSEDLNNLLGKHPDVERNHFKLWLPSTSVLQRLLHSGVFTQSALVLDDIKRHLSLFVPTEAVDRGLDMLDQNGFCMLTGIPGIGKTTTARILIAHHLDNEWEGIYLSNQAGKAFDVFHPTEKLIFFYDDFLGQTSLEEKLEKNEDKELKLLIQHCKKNRGTKRLVLTTREYLLEQARRQHEELSRSGIDIGECTVQLSDYTNRIRAEILVSHLYFFGVDQDVCSEFIRSGAAKKTITHTNYNPRIVEIMCEMHACQPTDHESFGGRFIELLDSPETIWEHAYNNQLSVKSRCLMLVFALLGDHVTIEALKDEFKALSPHVGIDMVGFDSMFDQCIKELSGCFLTIHSEKRYTYVAYHNPSVKDFTDRRLPQESHFLKMAIKHFTHDIPLLNAAELFVEKAAGKISGDEIIAAIERRDCKNIHVSVFDKYNLSTKPIIEPALSLSKWLQIADALEDSELIKQLFAHIERFIAKTEPGDDVLPTTNLYNKYIEVAKSVGIKPNLSIESFVDHCLVQCYHPDEFLSVYELINCCENCEEYVDQFSELFFIETEKWLRDEVQDSNTSDQINDAIGTLICAAEEIELSIDDMEINDIQQKADELSEREEEEANSYEHGWGSRHSEGQIENQAIEDTLNSIRD